MSDALRLVFDTSSPVVSVAVGRAEVVLAGATIDQRSSSRELIDTIDGCLEEAAASIRDVGEIVALRGPGSFTGLRIGLATAMGFHRALGIPVAAPSTLEVLAWAGRNPGTVLALVHALREEWYAQRFAGEPPVARSEPGREDREALVEPAPSAAIGHRLDRLAGALGDVPLVDPGPLAPVACGIPSDALAWDASALERPLYLAGPPVTRPPRPKGVLGDVD